MRPGPTQCRWPSVAGGMHFAPRWQAPELRVGGDQTPRGVLCDGGLEWFGRAKGSSSPSRRSFADLFRRLVSDEGKLVSAPLCSDGCVRQPSVTLFWLFLVAAVARSRLGQGCEIWLGGQGLVLSMSFIG